MRHPRLIHCLVLLLSSAGALAAQRLTAGLRADQLGVLGEDSALEVDERDFRTGRKAVKIGAPSAAGIGAAIGIAAATGALRRRGQRNSTAPDIVNAVRQLVLIANDDLIAGILNRNRLKTGHGNRWTRERVAPARRPSRTVP